MPKIENCGEGGEGIVVTVTPNYLLPKDYSRCSSEECPIKECLRLKSYLNEIKTNEIILVSEFGKNKEIKSAEDCNYFL